MYALLALSCSDQLTPFGKHRSFDINQIVEPSTYYSTRDTLANIRSWVLAAQEERSSVCGDTSSPAGWLSSK
jgi:hypothetical protein